MYKFANEIVVFDEKTRDKMLNAGYKLINDKITIVNNKPIEMVVPLGTDLDKAIVEQLEKVINENDSNNGIIEEKPRGNKKVSK